MSYFFIFILVFISSFLSVSITIFYMHKKTETVMAHLLQRMDNAIHGQIQEMAYDESMDAAITQRLNRLLQIAGMHKEQAELERDTIKALISDISHQVRTPLSNIMLYIELLREQALEKNIEGLADKIQKNSEKLDFFMKELVKSSYVEQEMILVHPKMVSVEELIDISCQNVELAAFRKKIMIKKELSKEVSEKLCYADKKWTIEALGNLLENAIKYSKEESMVQIRCKEQESFLCIEVQDDGIGIKEEEQGKVFERFYRSEQVKEQPGFGIGLYLVREVLSKQGGYLKLTSKLGKGTVIAMYLSRFGDSYYKR